MGQQGAIRVSGACQGAAPVTHAAEALRPVGLSTPAFTVLPIVGRAGDPSSPCVIGERVVVPRDTMAYI